MSETTSVVLDSTGTTNSKNTLVDGGNTTSLSDLEKSSQYHTQTANLAPANTVIAYPEGGRDAWLVVLGAWCGLTSSLGIYNTVGVFEAVVSNVVLPSHSPSTLGWIFSVYAFVNWVCGVQIGPTFDAMGPRALIIAGTLCIFGGIFALSFCTGMILCPASFKIIIAEWFWPLLTAQQSTTRSFCPSPS